MLKGTPNCLTPGLKTLHDAKILHRDIKSANIFLSNDIAKIGDLNISKLLQSDMATTQTGTPYYTCPEIWKDMPYSYKGDVWSLGCVIYEMCMLKPPFRAQQFEGLYQKVTSGVYERISFVYTSALNLFISRCLIVDEGKRASVDELLNSAFFKQFEKNTRKGAEI
jgi:NIMA (never in mitosis gene a)-related kinase